MADTNTQKVDPGVQKLFDLGAHLGHKKNRLFPKARKYIYKIINGVSIIDLSQTVTQLEVARAAMTRFANEGQSLLVVSTKKIGNQFIQNYCKENSIPFVTNKWLPGLLTNFDTIIKNVKKLKDLTKQKQEGEWTKFIKYEQVQLEKELAKLDRLYGGLVALEKKPDVLFIVDIKKEKNAVKEGMIYNIPIIALVDTNSNPDQITYPVVANDDSNEVVEYIANKILTCYIKPKKS